MSIDVFDYDLPKDLIAKYPPKKRGFSRLMVVDLKRNLIEHKRYLNIVDYLTKGDVVVLNNTRVIKARLLATVANSTKSVEVLLLNPIPEGKYDSLTWEVMIGNARYLKHANIINFGKGYKATITNKLSFKTFMAQFNASPLEIAKHLGKIPIPKYIKREDEPIDYVRYQTVFNKVPGSVAAPTASLNLTTAMLEEFAKKGVRVAYVTLYVGWGTFATINTKDITRFKIHSEYVIVPQETVNIVNKAVDKGQRVVAFGTTVVRTLEGVATKFGKLKPYKGLIGIYIYPGYKFKIVNTMVTNFHPPKSSTLVLTSAFVGIEKTRQVYKIAVAKKYKFLSYGDSMLILR